MMELTDDYLAAEPQLVALLETVEGLRKVYTSTDLAEVKARSQLTPAVHLIYAGDRLGDQAQGASLTHVTQTWVVILAVSQRQNNQSGALLAQLIKTLAGRHTTLGNLKRINAPFRPSFGGGFGYYPLTYEIQFRTKRSNP